MAIEQIPVSEFEPPQWVQDLRPSDREAYEQARQENIEEILPGICDILEEFLPGLSTERPEEFERTARRWATSCRNNFEVGIQFGKDAWGNQRDPYAESFMRNTVGNWAG